MVVIPPPNCEFPTADGRTNRERGGSFPRHFYRLRVLMTDEQGEPKRRRRKCSTNNPPTDEELQREARELLDAAGI